jgi:Rrf2 family protein
MKLITRNTDYAVRAVAYMAKKSGAIVTAAEMVAKLKIPRPFLRKIMQQLNRAGVVRSTRGIGGGFILVREPDKVRLTDIAKIFQGSFKLNECSFKKSLCGNRKICPLKKKIDAMESYIVEQLKGITLKDLI